MTTDTNTTDGQTTEAVTLPEAGRKSRTRTPAKTAVKADRGRNWTTATVVDRLLEILVSATPEGQTVPDKADLLLHPERTYLEDESAVSLMALLRGAVVNEAMARK